MGLVILPVRAEESLEGVTLRIIASANPDCVAFRDIVCKPFEKETGCKVQVDLYPYADVFSKEVLSFNGKLHDIYWLDTAWVPKYQKSGFLEQLDSYIRKYNVDMGRFFPTLVKNYTFGNNIYAIPAVSKAVLYGYRKDVFAEMGLTVPDTWDEVLKAAKKLTDPGRKRYGFVLRSERGNPICWSWIPILRSFGGEIFDKNMKPTFNSASSVASVEFLKELSKYSLPGDLSTDDVKNALANGIGMQTTIMTTVWPSLDDPKTSKVVGNFEYAHMPKGPSGERATMVGGAPYGIAKSSSTKIKEAAFRLLVFFLRDDIQKRLVQEVSTWYPAIPSMYESRGLHRSTLWNMRVQSYGGTAPLISEAEEWFQITGTALQEVLYRNKPAKQAMDEAVAKTYELLKEAGYYK
jgi:ABC-type glycerol-3-phosphate transport system substrate-binding protein